MRLNQIRLRISLWIMPRVQSSDLETDVLIEALAELIRSSAAAVALHDRVAAREFMSRIATIAQATMDQVQRDHDAGLHR